MGRPDAGPIGPRILRLFENFKARHGLLRCISARFCYIPKMTLSSLMFTALPSPSAQALWHDVAFVATLHGTCQCVEEKIMRSPEIGNGKTKQKVINEGFIKIVHKT